MYLTFGKYKLRDFLYNNKRNINSFSIDNFILIFYFIYLIITLCGFIFIKYTPISLYTISIYLIYVFQLYLGTFIGIRLKLNFRVNKLLIKSQNKFIFFWISFLSLITVYIWVITINKYGSLIYIIQNSYTIREATIGGDVGIVPAWMTYILSFSYGLFAILITIYGKTKNKKYLYTLIYLFILIIISDLQSFGRIGILFTIFLIAGYYIYSQKRIFSIRNSFLFFLLYSMLMLPRLIRGSFDNFSNSVNNYIPYLTFKLSSIFYGLLTIYIYYFSSLFAFNNLLNNEINYTFGSRNFAPIINLARKIIPSLNIDRINLIIQSEHIPFDFNIYSILGDIYLDFGLLGIIFIPLFFGLTIGIIFKRNGLYSDALKLIIFAWLFYTPIYNCFGFGGFFFSFCFLVFLSILFKENSNIYE